MWKQFVSFFLLSGVRSICTHVIRWNAATAAAAVATAAAATSAAAAHSRHKWIEYDVQGKAICTHENSQKKRKTKNKLTQNSKMAKNVYEVCIWKQQLWQRQRQQRILRSIELNSRELCVSLFICVSACRTNAHTHTHKKRTSDKIWK